MRHPRKNAKSFLLSEHDEDNGREGVLNPNLSLLLFLDPFFRVRSRSGSGVGHWVSDPLMVLTLFSFKGFLCHKPLKFAPNNTLNISKIYHQRFGSTNVSIEVSLHNEVCVLAADSRFVDIISEILIWLNPISQHKERYISSIFEVFSQMQFRQNSMCFIIVHFRNIIPIFFRVCKREPMKLKDYLRMNAKLLETFRDCTSYLSFQCWPSLMNSWLELRNAFERLAATISHQREAIILQKKSFLYSEKLWKTRDWIGYWVRHSPTFSETK